MESYLLQFEKGKAMETLEQVVPRNKMEKARNDINHVMFPFYGVELSRVQIASANKLVQGS